MSSQVDQISSEFQVAILMEDIKEAKSISDGLREIGIFAHYYQELDDLWVSLNTQTPDFCIVDVKLMSQGKLLFKQHAKVKSHELKYAFYYKESTKVLLNSTHGMNHYGLLRAEIDIVDQLKSILRRRNEELHLREQNETMLKRIERLKSRSQRLVEGQEKNFQLQSQHEKVKHLINKFGTINTPHDYLNRLMNFFNEWDDCVKFGIYHLNSTNQKLTSPKGSKSKYCTLPELWLTTENNDGIEKYALEMAYDVSYGIISDQVMSIKINGINENPEVIILATFNYKNLENFEWEILENKLDSEYRKSLINFYKSEKDDSRTEDIFETFQLMDDIQYNQMKSPYKFAVIDFSNLMNIVSHNLDNRFSWKAFYNDFNSEVRSLLSGNFKLSHYGSEFFIASLDKKTIETDFLKLKNYLDEMQVWRYFEDTTVMLSNDLNPRVRLVAPSAVNVIRQSKDAFSMIMNGENLSSSKMEPRQLEV